MTAVRVTLFDGRAADWDDWVRAQPGWTHFHLYGWRTVMEQEFQHECVYLVARDQKADEIVGVLPLVRVRSLVFGHFLVSMPFLNYAGPLGSVEAIRGLVVRAVDIARQSDVQLLELRSRGPLPIDLPVSHRKLTVLLDLPTETTALWDRLPSKLRSQIRRPRKDGVVVRSGRDQVGPFHEVFAEHMRDLGTPAHARSLFETIADVFGRDAVFAVAYHEGKPVACGAGFRWNGEFEITWASALRSHSALSPNMLVYWELMEQAILGGDRLFNFGRCSRGSGTHRFKMQWGGREEELWWYQRAASSQPAEGASTPSPDQGIFALATRVWQRLPVPVATRIGPAIVRYLP